MRSSSATACTSAASSAPARLRRSWRKSYSAWAARSESDGNKTLMSGGPTGAGRSGSVVRPEAAGAVEAGTERDRVVVEVLGPGGAPTDPVVVVVDARDE